MTFSLYDATVANYLQILGAVVGGFLDKRLKHFREKGIDPAEIVETRLATDMLPLRFQIFSVTHHSRGAIEAAKKGVFVPSGGQSDLDYSALQGLVTEARNELSLLTQEDVNALGGRDVVFKFGDRSLQKTSSCRSRCRISFSMRQRLTTFYDTAARHLESAISWAS
jgi:uncharacterized protein